ncbi:MAG TPA: HupE/UreJ family protein, partial [Burkholderiaceae bacterium]
HAHGFAAGFTHPFTGLDHLAAMLAVGMWSAQSQRAWRMVWAPLSFASLLTLGALAGMAGVALPAVEPMVSASVLILGLVLAVRWQLSPGTSAALVGLFAVFHGLAHGGELNGTSALSGMVLATALLHGTGLLLGLKLRPLAIRVAGSSLALLGIALMVST